METQEKNLPMYRCHKEVQAMKIKQVMKISAATKELSDLIFEDDSFPAKQMSAEWVKKHKPVAGGYYVRYADGYESFSPAEAFEEGYSLIEEGSDLPDGANEVTVEDVNQVANDLMKSAPDELEEYPFGAYGIGVNAALRSIFGEKSDGVLTIIQGHLELHSERIKKSAGKTPYEKGPTGVSNSETQDYPVSGKPSEHILQPGERPSYRSTKIVKALKVKSVELNEEDGSAIITPEEEGHEPFTVNQGFIHTFNPVPGGYHVIDAVGGHSFLPEEYFEEKYERIHSGQMYHELRDKEDRDYSGEEEILS